MLPMLPFYTAVTAAAAAASLLLLHRDYFSRSRQDMFSLLFFSLSPVLGRVIEGVELERVKSIYSSSLGPTSV